MIDPSKLDFVLPDGTKLRDATGAQMPECEWLLAIADQLKPHETPSSRERLSRRGDN
jgi:hypothetical protein